MADIPHPNRRQFLGTACAAAAAAGLGEVTLAAAPVEPRLVVIMLRGAVDGLDIVRPLGDPDLRRIRPVQVRSTIAEDWIDPVDLDGFFALHGLLAPLAPFWQRGEMAVAHAVSTPYREARSHFDGQDLLETGGNFAGERRDGWLNRALGHIPGAGANLGINVGLDVNLVMRGNSPILSWSPAVRFDEAAKMLDRLDALYGGDPAFRKTLNDAAKAHHLSASVRSKASPAGVAELAAQALRGDARIAAFTVGGWDTHANQGTTIRRPMNDLRRTVETLHATLGPAVWARTAVLALTEFGRTARVNGTKGTDHGTGGAALLFGGLLARAQVDTDWPGLGDGALYRDRDLMPTRDVRVHAAALLHDLYGIPRRTLETEIFPGLDLSYKPRLVAV